MDSATFLAVLVFWAGIGSFIGYAIGKPKGLGSLGAGLGLFLGFIGWIAVALMPGTPTQGPGAGLGPAQRRGPQRTCPWCAEEIMAAAQVCRYCQRDLEPLEVVPKASTATWAGSRILSGDVVVGDEVFVNGKWVAVVYTQSDEANAFLTTAGGEQLVVAKNLTLDARSGRS